MNIRLALWNVFCSICAGAGVGILCFAPVGQLNAVVATLLFCPGVGLVVLLVTHRRASEARRTRRVNELIDRAVQIMEEATEELERARRMIDKHDIQAGYLALNHAEELRQEAKKFLREGIDLRRRGSRAEEG